MGKERVQLFIRHLGLFLLWLGFVLLQILPVSAADTASCRAVQRSLSRTSGSSPRGWWLQGNLASVHLAVRWARCSASGAASPVLKAQVQPEYFPGTLSTE